MKRINGIWYTCAGEVLIARNFEEAVKAMRAAA